MWWGWPIALKAMGSPFHDSMLLLLWGCGWVEHNDRFRGWRGLWASGSARCWVLRGHLVTGCFFWLLLAWIV